MLLLAGHRWWLLWNSLRLLDEDRPVFGNGQLTIKGRCSLARLYANGHRKLGLGASTIDAVGRWNVGVVATDCRAVVAVASDEIIGWIKANPAELGQKCFDPCVRCGTLRAVLMRIAVVEIATDISAWNLLILAL